ncbi:hypothetical protein [Shimia sp.]|uniref:hypothetical protein n=1 Tax=Shimia sp. TaxID=1954381 RepID=UPI003BA9352A
MKRLLIVTGFESSGSVFLARVASHVLQKCKTFGAWDGYGWNGDRGDDLVIIHRSMPYSRGPKKWFEELQDEIKDLADYDVRFVICTRDLSISRTSRQLRFGGATATYKADDARARDIFANIMQTHEYYIFSFESALALREIYYQDFYKWLGVESSFSPPLFDANAPYVKFKTPQRAIKLARMSASRFRHMVRI